MITVPILTGTPYEVHIGTALLKNTGELAAACIKPCKAVIISDSNVAPLYLETVTQSLASAGYTVLPYSFPAGEASKNIHTLESILEYLAAANITRSDYLVALGGGVTGDLTGFAASVYMRGIRYIQLPTSLLACVDSSVGGKTAVNLSAGKNLAGTFWQPSLVICDTNTLKTLSADCLLDGISESLKYGLIRDASLFQKIVNGSFHTDCEATIASCIRMKGTIVAEDEFDNGTRELLNFGHTFGHSLESLSHFSISHGHAVAMGMNMAGKVSAALHLCDMTCSQDLTAALSTLHLPVHTPYTGSQMLPIMLRDKKRRGSTIDLILPLTIGKCVIHPVSITELSTILDMF